VALGFWLLPAIPIHAQVLPNTPRQNLWATNGTVYAIQPVGNTIYLGGNFSYVGPATGGGVPLATSDGKALASFPHVQGSLSAVVADGAGGWYIGGAFTHVGSSARINLAHILADDSVDPNWNPNASGTVSTLLS
jgi:hypothetical protein